MKRKIKFDAYELLQFIDALQAFLIMKEYHKYDLLNMARNYLVAKFMRKLEKQLGHMLEEDRSSAKVSFDGMHIALIVDVLQRVPATNTTLQIINILAGSAPRDVLKINLPNS